MSKEHQPEAQLPSEPNICPKCNQAYIETHICTAESNQSFESLLDRLVLAYGSVPEESSFNRSAIITAHESDKAQAVRAAQLTLLNEMLSHEAPYTLHGKKVGTAINSGWVRDRIAALTKGESND